MGFSIAGKTAIVTGAANGIGLAITKHFLDAGANVIMADIDEERLEIETTLLDGRAVHAFAGDVSQKLTVANLLSYTIDNFERVDILVNASRSVVTSDPLEPRADGVETLFKQNVLSALRLSQTVAKRMIQQNEDQLGDGAVGSIINLSSIAAERTHPDLLAYSLSCAAINQMTRSLAVGFAEHGIRVNAIAIGSVISANLERLLSDDEGVGEDMENATPLGRLADAQEICQTAQYLASGASSFVTGQILTVDGGRTLFDPLKRVEH